NAVLDECSWVLDPVEALEIGVILREEQLRIAVAVQPVGLPPFRVLDKNAGFPARRRKTEPGSDRAGFPRPRVSAPESGEEMKGRGIRSAVGDRDANQQIVRRCLRILGDDVEVAVLLEDSGVDELELGITAAAPLVLLDEPRVGKLTLGILVETLHVGVGRRRVEIEVVVLDVLAVIPLGASEAEHPLLENRVPLVPEREREAEPLVVVRDP